MTLHEWPYVEGECARLLTSQDWTRSPLGQPEVWSRSLRGAVQNVLASPLPIYVAWGPELALIYNDAYIEILGERHPESLGMPFSKVWPEAASQVVPLLERVLQGEVTSEREALFVLQRDGIPVQTWFDFSVSPFRDGAGVVKGALCLCTERTAEVLQKAQTDAQLSFLNRTLKQAPCFFAITRGPDYRYVFTNDAHSELHGRDVLGLTVREVMAPPFADKLISTLERVKRTGETIVSRARKMSGRNRERTTTVGLLPLVEEGERVGVVIIGFDVTASEETQLHLARTEARFKAITDAMPQMVFATGPNGNTYVNGQFCKYVGKPSKELMGDAWTEYIHDNDRELAVNQWAAAVVAGREYEARMRVRRADGQYRWMLVRALPVQDARGNSSQ